MALSSTVKRQIVRNTLTGWGYRILKVGFAIFTNPLLISGLGKEGYSLVALLGALVGFSELTDLGIRPALARELSEARTAGKAETVNRLASSALAVYLTLFGALALALLAATHPLARLMAGADAGPLNLEAIWLLRTYGVFALAVAFVRPVYSAVLASSNRFDYRNQAESLFTLVNGSATIAVLGFTDWGLAGWVGVNALTQALNLGQIIVYAHRAQPDLRIRPSLVDLGSIRHLYALGSGLFISQWARKIKFDADPIVIARYLTPAAVALYKPPVSLMSNIRPLLNTFTGQLFPVTTQLYTQGSGERMQALFLASSRYALLMAVPVGVFFGLYGAEIMDLWLGHVLAVEDVRVAGQVLAAWALIEVAVAMEGSSWSVLFGMKRVRFFVWGELVAAMLNLAASLWLVQATDWGVLAVALPSVVLEGIFRPIYALYTAGAAGLPIGFAALKLYGRPALVAMALTALALGLRYALPSFGFFWLGVHGAALGLAFFGLTSFVGLTGTERGMMVQAMRKRFGA